jgi:hypothetical protein
MRFAESLQPRGAGVAQSPTIQSPCWQMPREPRHPESAIPAAGPGATGGGQALIAICDSHGLDDAVGVLDTWLNALSEATRATGARHAPD